MVTVTAEKVIDRYPLQLDVQVLRSVLEDTEEEIALYEGIVRDFETQWGSDLAEFEKRIAEGELPEHPSWEISIEWGVAADELQKLHQGRGLSVVRENYDQLSEGQGLDAPCLAGTANSPDDIPGG